MESINCVIDTHPMASSINSVSKHINGTTAAVVGMKAAVIKAEQDAADHVCANVNKGFYTLIRSQISQKIAKLQSEVDSHLMQLNQQRKQLLAIKSRMERDYNMIASRYLKLFTGINRNLQQRVFDLDRPVMNFAVRDMEQVSNRAKHLTATIPLGQSESVKDSQHFIASNVKFRGMQVLGSINRFLSESLQLQEITDRILLDERTPTARREIMMPVIVSESKLDEHGNVSSQIYVSGNGMPAQAQADIKNAVESNARHLSWSNAQEPSAELRNEFAKRIDESQMSRRAKEIALKLFNDSRIATLNQTQPEL